MIQTNTQLPSITLHPKTIAWLKTTLSWGTDSDRFHMVLTNKKSFTLQEEVCLKTQKHLTNLWGTGVGGQMEGGSWITWLHSELLGECCLYVMMGSSGDVASPLLVWVSQRKW